ncbi:hypothetical protein [Erwinia phage Snitter]|nr:hypothetical protein [Erwinia phage Snitter]
MKTLLCTRNTSKAFSFVVGKEYQAEYLGGGHYRVYGENSERLTCPVDGHYIGFEVVKP